MNNFTRASITAMVACLAVSGCGSDSPEASVPREKPVESSPPSVAVTIASSAVNQDHWTRRADKLFEKTYRACVAGLGPDAETEEVFPGSGAVLARACIGRRTVAWPEASDRGSYVSRIPAYAHPYGRNDRRVPAPGGDFHYTYWIAHSAAALAEKDLPMWEEVRKQISAAVRRHYRAAEKTDAGPDDHAAALEKELTPLFAKVNHSGSPVEVFVKYVYIEEILGPLDL